MQIHSIYARNFLSLQNCNIDDLDPHMTFLVGPNGAGKTTIIRLLRMIRDVFTGASTGNTPALDHLCTRDVLPPRMNVRVTVEFDTLWEQELITAFLCTALSQPTALNAYLSQVQVGNVSERRSFPLPVYEYFAFTRWLLKVLEPKTVPFLFRGDLEIRYHHGIYEELELGYTFRCEGRPIVITAGGNTSGIDGGFSQYLSSKFSAGGPPGGEVLLKYLKMVKEKEIGKEYDLLSDMFTGGRKRIAESFDAKAFFLHLVEQKGFLKVDQVDPQYAELPPYLALSSLSKIPLSQQAAGRPLTFSAMLSLILKRAFIFTNNVRAPLSPLIELDVNQAFSNESFDDEQQIPMWLFRLKNGTMEEQERFRRIQMTFSDLMGGEQNFDLTIKLLPLQHKNPSQVQVSTIDLRVIDTKGDVSLVYQGTGAWEALVLSTLLDESAGKIVLLDEPAANLHPGMQHKLVEVLATSPGQIIVVTHSSHLLPTHADGFHRVYRMQKNLVDSQVFRLGKTFVEKQDKLENELRSSSDVAGLLFANGVLLVEGGTEIGAFSEWFPRSSTSQSKTFADLNIALHALDGKAEIPFYLRFLTAFGVPWSVICDGDALLPPDKSPNDKLWKTLKEFQLISEMPSSTTSFEVLRAQAAKVGVYTYDTLSPTKFETIPEVKHYLDAEWTPPGKTVYRGRYIAIHIPCPSLVDEVLQQSMKQLIVR